MTGFGTPAGQALARLIIYLLPLLRSHIAYTRLSRLLLTFSFSNSAIRPFKASRVGMYRTSRSKTHADPARVIEINRMSRVEKMVENAAITGRNALRALKRSIAKENAKEKAVAGTSGEGESETTTQDIDAVSDDESVISIPEEADGPPPPPPPPPPPIPGMDALEKMANAFLAAMGKRAASPVSGETLHGSKRIRLASAVESTAGVGEVEDVKVPLEIWDLHNSGAYTPLGLFTLESIRTIQDCSHSLKGVKGPVPLDGQGKFTMAKIINPSSPGLTQEVSMSEVQWSFATRTMVIWAGEVKSDEVLKSWLLNHFKWVAGMRVSGKTDFDTALAFDIDMRTRYHRSPFAFTTERWYTEYIFFVQQREKARRDAQEDHYRNRQQQGGSHSNSSYAGGSSSSGDSSKGRKSFRSGQAGGNGGEKTPGCPICLTEGHKVGDCKATKRADGKSLYAKLTADGKNLIAVAGGAFICLLWNIFGRSTPKCDHHSNNPAAHRCSACGSGDHHALSYACLKRN